MPLNPSLHSKIDPLWLRSTVVERRQSGISDYEVHQLRFSPQSDRLHQMTTSAVNWLYWVFRPYRVTLLKHFCVYALRS